MPNAGLKTLVLYYLSWVLCSRSFGGIVRQSLIWESHAITDAGGLQSSKELTKAGKFTSSVV